MNWRALLGLALTLIGGAELYVLMSHRNNIKAGETPVYAIAACFLWIAIGIFLMFRGLRKKAS